MPSAEAARAAVAPLSLGLARVAARPREALGALVLVHWLLVAAFALTVRHNGLVYYQGGDQIGYTTTAWLVAHGDLPPTFTGWGWVLPLVPVAWVTGPDYVSFLPWIMLLNVAVLAPVAIACVYGIAARLAGRVFGLWAAAAWVAAPFVAIPLFRQDYHERFVEQFLPQALGLTGLADYPSTVCLLLASWLTLRALDSADWTWAAVAGFAAGFAVAVKPANLLFLAGPFLALLLARRIRLGVPFVAGLAPPLALLLLWKVRGLGGLPALAAPETRVAAGATVAALGIDFGRYLDYDLDVFRSNMANLREYFWSVRLLQWAPFAGLLAVGRRSLATAGLLAGWFFAFLLVKGTVTQSTVESGSFFRLLMPAFPAYFLLLVAIPLLVPAARRAAAPLVSRPRPLGPRVLAAVAILLVAVPLVLVLAPQPVTDDRPGTVEVNDILVPEDDRIQVEVAADGERRTVTWTHPDFGATKVFYRVFRTEAGGADLDCIGAGARECRLQMLELAGGRDARYVDQSPPADALYRIGVATNWQDDPKGGDVIAISPPVPATP